MTRKGHVTGDIVVVEMGRSGVTKLSSGTRSLMTLTGFPSWRNPSTTFGSFSPANGQECIQDQGRRSMPQKVYKKLRKVWAPNCNFLKKVYNTYAFRDKLFFTLYQQNQVELAHLANLHNLYFENYQFHTTSFEKSWILLCADGWMREFNATFA